MKSKRYEGYYKGKKVVGPIKWHEMMQMRANVKLKWKGVVA